MRNPCEDCGKVCIAPDCFALKVYSACERNKKKRHAKERYANYIANSYHYAVVDKAMRRGGWRKR